MKLDTTKRNDIKSDKASALEPLSTLKLDTTKRNDIKSDKASALEPLSTSRNKFYFRL